MVTGQSPRLVRMMNKTGDLKSLDCPFIAKSKKCITSYSANSVHIWAHFQAFFYLENLIICFPTLYKYIWYRTTKVKNNISLASLQYSNITRRRMFIFNTKNWPTLLMNPDLLIISYQGEQLWWLQQGQMSKDGGHLSWRRHLSG